MGGDGGVVATNRRYMRGAGTADHTGDNTQTQRASASELAESERQRAQRIMSTCALTGRAFSFRPSSGGGGSANTSTDGEDESTAMGIGNGSNLHNNGAATAATIVSCPYGRLYDRTAALEALLRRAQRQKRGNKDNARHGHGERCKEKKEEHEQENDYEDEIGWHVGNLSDLHPVRFHLAPSSSHANVDHTDNDGNKSRHRLVPTCPVTQMELNGIHPAYLIVTTPPSSSQIQHHHNDDRPNVLSEKAFKVMKAIELQEEYGPYDSKHMIRLAPPSHLLQDIMEQWDITRRIRDEEKKKLKMEKKQKKKLEQQLKRKKKKMKEKDNTMLEETKSQHGQENSGRQQNQPSHKKQKFQGRGGDRDRDTKERKVRAGDVHHRTKHGNATHQGSVSVSAADMARSNVASAVQGNAILSKLFCTSQHSNSLSEKEKKDNLFAR